MATPELQEQDADTHGGQLAQLRDFIRQATDAREEYERWGAEYAFAATREAELEAERPFVKQEAILRLITEEKIAATNAEKQAVTDPKYVVHLDRQRDAVANKNNAHTRMESAKMRVQIALAAVRASGDLR